MSMSPEARRAMSERMKARHAANKVAKETPNKAPETPEQPDLSKAPNIENEDYASLKRQVQELQAMLERVANQQTPLPAYQGAQAASPAFHADPRRGLVGTIEKFVVDPSYYPDMTDRLAKEPRLARFAFLLNYELGWKVETVSYETKDGLNVKEPKFSLNLIRIILDEDTGEPTNKRFITCTQVFFEDPQTALVVARDNGLSPDEFPGGEKNFLDEMRYLRMRDWLLEAFYPPKSQPKNNKREMVIGNKVVEVYEVNAELSEGAPSINFSGLTKKL